MIYGSLKNPSLNRFAKVTNFSLAASLVCCFALAIPGYLSFTDRTQGNILNNFPDDNLMINIARFVFAITMYLTYPLELFVTREVLHEVFIKNSKSNFHHYLLTILLIAASFGIAVAFTDLGVVFELTVWQ